MTSGGQGQVEIASEAHAVPEAEVAALRERVAADPADLPARSALATALFGRQVRTMCPLAWFALGARDAPLREAGGRDDRGQRYRRGIDKGVRATCPSRQRRSLGLATLSCVGDSVLRRWSCVGGSFLRRRCRLATEMTCDGVNPAELDSCKGRDRHRHHSTVDSRRNRDGRDHRRTVDSRRSRSLRTSRRLLCQRGLGEQTRRARRPTGLRATRERRPADMAGAQ